MDGITQTAGQQLKLALEQTQAPEDRAVRLVSGESGDELKLDAQSDQDKSFEHEQRTVLVVDPQTAEKHSGRKLDYKEGRFCFV